VVVAVAVCRTFVAVSLVRLLATMEILQRRQSRLQRTLGHKDCTIRVIHAVWVYVVFIHICFMTDRPRGRPRPDEPGSIRGSTWRGGAGGGGRYGQSADSMPAWMNDGSDDEYDEDNDENSYSDQRRLEKVCCARHIQ
jgi:hypothetical protein